MLQYLLKRILLLIPTLFFVSVLSYSIILLVPGDPAEILLTGPDGGADPETVEKFRKEKGLDQPFLVQYGKWLAGVLSGNLGYSYMTEQPVAKAIVYNFRATLKLALLSMGFALLIAVPVGIVAALAKNTWKDFAGRLFALFGTAVPNFWQGYLMILIFALWLDVLPVGGYGDGGDLKHMVLPAVTLGTSSAAVLMRLTRSGLLEVLEQDFIRGARARGVNELTVIGKHALKNSLIPVATMLGLSFGYLLNGSVIVETVFAWPGIGNLMVNSIYNRDYPMVQGILLYIASIFVFVNVAVDLLYVYLDPRVRYESETE